jgi:tetratricopeptide (TPR) repeat protein
MARSIWPIAFSLLVVGASALTVMPEQAALAKTRLKAGIYIYTGNPATDKLLNSGQYDQAEKQSLAQLRSSPNNMHALIGAGWSQAKLFKLDAADANFSKALAENSQNAVAHFGKAMVVVNRLQSSSGTIIKNKEALLQQAEAQCKQGLAIDSGFPEGHYVLASVYKEQKRVDDAVREFQAAVSADPKYADGYSGLGMALLDKNDNAGAMQAANQAISLNSKNSTAHYVRGEVYRRQGQLDNALKELNTALYQNRNSAPVYLSQGKTFAAQGNSPAAVNAFQKSIGIKAENSEAYLGIADIREARGDIELSIGELHSALDLMPNNPDLHQRVADESLRVEKLDDAIKEYTAVMNMAPGNAGAAEGLTRAYYLKANKEATGAFFVSNDFESAKGMIDKAVAMNPNNMELRLAQVKLRAMSGEKIDLATVPQPTNNGERIAYAEACLAQNKYKEADDQMNMVIGSTTDRKQMFAVGDLALMIHDLPNAENAYKRAATMPGGNERAQRGLALVAKAKDAARQDDTLADDLARKGQVKSALDKYRSTTYANPRVADAHLGFANALQKDKPETSAGMRQAAIQYRAYVALSPNLPPK